MGLSRISQRRRNSESGRISCYRVRPKASRYHRKRGEAIFGKIAICVDPNDERFDDTIFTVDNYIRPQLDFLLAALQADNNKSYLDWFLKGTGSSYIKSGIKRDVGPNSYLLLGFDDVKETLESWDDRINSGDMERKNELGIQILENSLWPENPGGRMTIGLGQS